MTGSAGSSGGAAVTLSRWSAPPTYSPAERYDEVVPAPAELPVPVTAQPVAPAMVTAQPVPPATSHAALPAVAQRPLARHVVGQASAHPHTRATIADLREMLVARGVSPQVVNQLSPGTRELAVAVYAHEQGRSGADIDRLIVHLQGQFAGGGPRPSPRPAGALPPSPRPALPAPRAPVEAPVSAPTFASGWGPALVSPPTEPARAAVGPDFAAQWILPFSDPPQRVARMRVPRPWQRHRVTRPGACPGTPFGETDLARRENVSIRNGSGGPQLPGRSARPGPVALVTA